MIWLQPLAWIGAAAIAVPVIVHLLARRQAVVEAFPTLRFLRTAQSAAVRRHRLSEWLLLAVRIAIVAAATAALAQPLLLTRARRAASAANLSRAVIVDASASMQRRTTDGRTGLDVARARATELVSAASTATTGEAAQVAAAIDGALGWLHDQAGHRELVIVSDFAAGVIGPEDIARIPDGIGVTLERVDVVVDPTVTTPAWRRTDGDVLARATVDANRTNATWTIGPMASLTADALVASAAGTDEQPAVDAARAAALSAGWPPPRADRPVTIVFPHAVDRDAIARQASRVDRPWMAGAVAQLARDTTLIDASRGVTPGAPIPAGLTPDRSTLVMSAANGTPLVIAAAREISGVHQLVLFSLADAANAFSAALFSRAAAAVSPITVGEAEPLFVPADDLRRWQRAPSEVAPPANGSSGDSDGRWLWIAVLVLIAIETWLRRQRPARAEPAEVIHARVA